MTTFKLQSTMISINKIVNKIRFYSHRENQGYEFPRECQRYSDTLSMILNKNLTMVGPARLAATALACEYVVREEIPGDFVECGVWRGGNSILAKIIFSKLNARSRKVWLFDTFQGMTKPTDKDFRFGSKESALETYLNSKHEISGSKWCRAELDEVKNNFFKMNSNLDNVKFVSGDIAETLKEEFNIPKEISVLRLDTDWYESTLLALEYLYPRLSKNGVIIIDDFGHWEGSRNAVEKFFVNKNQPLFNVIDYTGRMGIKI